MIVSESVIQKIIRQPEIVQERFLESQRPDRRKVLQNLIEYYKPDVPSSYFSCSYIADGELIKLAVDSRSTFESILPVAKLFEDKIEVTAKQVINKTGINKGTARKALEILTDAGHLYKYRDSGMTSFHYSREKPEVKPFKTIKERVFDAIPRRGEFKVSDITEKSGCCKISVSARLRIFRIEGLITCRKAPVGKAYIYKWVGNDEAAK